MSEIYYRGEKRIPFMEHVLMQDTLLVNRNFMNIVGILDSSSISPQFQNSLHGNFRNAAVRIAHIGILEERHKMPGKPRYWDKWQKWQQLKVITIQRGWSVLLFDEYLKQESEKKDQ